MGKARELGALALFALGCSTTATITPRSTGGELEGTIQGGTPTSVIIETEDGRLEEIPRDDIRDIDHPGNVHALVGGLAVGLGGMMLLGQSEACDRNYTADCFTPAVPIAVGAVLMIWGIPVWRSSVEAVGKSSLKPLHPQYGRPPPRGGKPPNDVLPPPAPAPPGYVGPGAPAPAPSGAAPAPSTPPPAPTAPTPVPSASAPTPSPPAPPAEPDAGGVVW